MGQLSSCTTITEPVCPNYGSPCLLRAYTLQLLGPLLLETVRLEHEATAMRTHAPQLRVAPAYRNYRKPMHSSEDPETTEVPAQPKLNT